MTSSTKKNRGVVNEDALVAALQSHIGPHNLHVFTGGAMDPDGLKRQVGAFRNAHIVIGSRLLIQFGIINIL